MVNARFEAAKAMIGRKIGPYTLIDVYWETKSPITGIKFARGRTDLFAELICDKCQQNHRILFLDWIKAKPKACKNCKKKKPQKRGPSGKVALGLASGLPTKEKEGIKIMLQMYSVEYVAEALNLPESEIRLVKIEKIQRRKT